MKGFLRKIGIFGIILLLLFIVCGIDLDKSRHDTEYMAAVIDKHRKLAATSGPRILFTGGSNIAFGVNCKALQDQLQQPVINLGIHVRLGLSYLLNELKAVAKPGDKVFLSLEYFLDEGNYKLKRRMASYLPESAGYFRKKVLGELGYYFDRKLDNIKNNRQLLFSRLTSLGGAVSSNTDALYARKGFDANGDFIAHYTEPQPAEIQERGKFAYQHWDGIEKLNDFYKWAQVNGVKVFFLYPAYPATEYEKNKEIIQRYHNDLKKELQMPVIGTPEDFVYPDNLFFDTIYHLNQQGIEQKTAKLLSVIAPYTRD